MSELAPVAPASKFHRIAERAKAPAGRERNVALFPAGGELWDDFLDTINVPLEQFCEEGPGGWILGYIDALATADIGTLLVFFSQRTREPLRYVDPAAGTRILVLPPTRAYTYLRRKTGQGGMAQAEFTPLAAVNTHLSTPFLRLARLLRREGCSALLCQEYEHFRFEACLVLGRMLRVPVFASFQGRDVELNPISRAIKRRSIRAADGLFIAASTEIERVRERYGPERPPIFQIFNPVDVREWTGDGRKAARAELGLAPNTRAVVWHGRIAIHDKGLDVMLKAWKRVRDARPGADLRLILTGTGQDAAEFRRMVESQADGSILWRDDYVTDRKLIRRRLAAGDIYAFPSRSEGFAVAPLEAMACGLPVVAADASGVPDIFSRGEEDGGLVVSRGDVETFAEALGRLIDQPDYARSLGAHARRRMEQAFSLEAVGSQMRAAFDGTQGKGSTVVS